MLNCTKLAFTTFNHTIMHRNKGIFNPPRVLIFGEHRIQQGVVSSMHYCTYSACVGTKEIQPFYLIWHLYYNRREACIERVQRLPLHSSYSNQKRPKMIETKAVTPELLDDVDSLFCTNKPADRCWCMWHIISVKAFHEGGPEQNRAKFVELAQAEELPIGVLAYQNGEPKGWCAVGPRERYARAIKAPTYRTKEEDPFSKVWLVPCFMIHSDARGQGLSKQLLETAVALATTHGAEAIDGFPFTSGKRRSGGPIHVGFESTFRACGFEPIRHPSDSRVVMRRVLGEK